MPLAKLSLLSNEEVADVLSLRPHVQIVLGRQVFGVAIYDPW